MAVKNKQAHFRAPVALNSPHKTPWVALRASLQNFKENPNSFKLVRGKGLEPEECQWHYEFTFSDFMIDQATKPS